MWKSGEGSGRTRDQGVPRTEVRYPDPSRVSEKRSGGGEPDRRKCIYYEVRFAKKGARPPERPAVCEMVTLEPKRAILEFPVVARECREDCGSRMGRCNR